MKIILDSAPLEPLPVLDDSNRVTAWLSKSDDDVIKWYNSLARSGLRALVVEHEGQRCGYHGARAVYRYPAAVQVPE